MQIAVNLEREDDDVSPHVIAPFFPQVSVVIKCFIVIAGILSHRNGRKDGGLSLETLRQTSKLQHATTICMRISTS